MANALDKSPYAVQIKQKFDELQGKATIQEFHDIVKTIDPNLNCSTATTRLWMLKQKSIKNKLLPDDPKRPTSLMDREVERRKQQIELRQDATSLMRDFVAGLRELTADQDNLKAMPGKTITEVYKIIREEEDRQKALNLRERAENRADAQFAFMLSITRAGIVTDDDIQFLSDDIKNELKFFQKEHGVYQLPTPGGVEEFSAPAENNAARPDAIPAQGSV